MRPGPGAAADVIVGLDGAGTWPVLLTTAGGFAFSRRSRQRAITLAARGVSWRRRLWGARSLRAL